jgi:hypothetical protein
MPTGVSTDVLGMNADADDHAYAPDPNSTDSKQVQVALGSDNPYFDFRRPGDRGGIGFYRLHSQVVLTDSRVTGLAMGLQAVAPAGWEAGGIEHGPTVVSPNFAWFYELGGGAALRAFVGKSVFMHANWSDDLGRNVRYGVALQSPFPGLDARSSPTTHVFVEALGRNRYDGDPTPSSSSDVEIIPGVQWRWRDTTWLSSGVLMPIDGWSPARLSWQVTCSWQY